LLHLVDLFFLQADYHPPYISHVIGLPSTYGPDVQAFKLKLQVPCTMHDEHVLTYRGDGVGAPIDIGGRPCLLKDSSKIELPVLVE